MIINRKFEDAFISCELTQAELCAAYKEYQHILDKEFVKNEINKRFRPKDDHICVIEKSEKYLSEIAKEYRSNKDKYGWNDNVDTVYIALLVTEKANDVYNENFAK